jgi:hypothetical protein
MMVRTACVVAVSLVLGIVACADAGAATSLHANGATAHLRPPVATGTLRIDGALRDGGWVRAAGLIWRPSKLPPGDRLLSFEVAYSWSSCGPRRCRPAADRTATPFAARHYVVGHADTGRRLRLSVTATQVVETDPATFSFSVIRAHRRVTTSAVVAAYPAGRRPSIQFLNGLPEWRTGSNAENFQVTAPHHNAADGATRVTYRVDGSSWRLLPRTRVFGARHLRPGPHHVVVRVANAAGVFRRSFGWRVQPLSAPAVCEAPCWAPPQLDSQSRPMRWDWQIGRVTPLQRSGARAVDIYDIDGFLTTRPEIHAIHTAWPAATLPHPRAVCYLDLAWEDYRPDASPGTAFPARTLGRVYYGYPQERWVDFRQLHALRPMLDARIGMCARKGFDTVEFDDIDSFDPPKTTGFQLTPGDAQNYLAYADNRVHSMGLSVLWKNSPLLSWWGRRYSDGAVLEECYPYRQCTSSQLAGTRAYGIRCTLLSGRRPCGWDGFTSRGKWVGDAEYVEDHYVCAPSASCTGRHRYSAFCSSVQGTANGFAAVRFDVDLDGRVFQPCPSGR